MWHGNRLASKQRHASSYATCRFTNSAKCQCSHSSIGLTFFLGGATNAICFVVFSDLCEKSISLEMFSVDIPFAKSGFNLSLCCIGSVLFYGIPVTFTRTRTPLTFFHSVGKFACRICVCKIHPGIYLLRGTSNFGELSVVRGSSPLYFVQS